MLFSVDAWKEKEKEKKNFNLWNTICIAPVIQ